MSQIILYGVAVCSALFQISIMMVIAPFFIWALTNLPLWVSGRSVVSVWEVYRRFLVLIWCSLEKGLRPREGVALTLVLTVFLALPGASYVIEAEGVGVRIPIEDPLLIGGLMLVAINFLMPVVLVGRYIGAALILCMSEALLEVAAPGVNGLMGVHTLLQLTAGSGLAGTSIFCALALAVSNPLPTETEFTQYLIMYDMQAKREQRDQIRLLLDLLHVGWLLLVADLLLPVLMGGKGWVSIVNLLIRLSFTLIIIVLLRLTGIERHPHVVALLIGLGFLIALAGRFAT